MFLFPMLSLISNSTRQEKGVYNDLLPSLSLSLPPSVPLSLSLSLSLSLRLARGLRLGEAPKPDTGACAVTALLVCRRTVAAHMVQ